MTLTREEAKKLYRIWVGDRVRNTQGDEEGEVVAMHDVVYATVRWDKGFTRFSTRHVIDLEEVKPTKVETEIPWGTIKRIHVNQHVIRANAASGDRNPVLTIKTGKKNHYAHEVSIDGPSKVVYSPDKPLSCGAKVWVETVGKVIFKSEREEDETCTTE